MKQSTVFDLAGVVLEITNLDKAEHFYRRLGLQLKSRDDARGVMKLGFASGQSLTLWKPLSRAHNNERLARLGARGASHLHYAMQIPKGSRSSVQALLKHQGIDSQEINLAAEGDEPDIGLYFFDPFGHGLELREVQTNPSDPRFPHVAPGPLSEDQFPVVGLREVALAFEDFEAMLTRLPRLYGFLLVHQFAERAFAQFVLGPKPEKDGRFTPRRWLYAWDIQVGLADMLGGEHATVQFYADVERIQNRLEAANIPHICDSLGLAVRDPSGHVFEFLTPPSQAR